MRLAFAFALLLAAPALAGCFGASDEPQAGESTVVPAGDGAGNATGPRTFVLREEGKSTCDLYIKLAGNLWTAWDCTPATLPVKAPAPANATLTATWSGGPATIRFTGTAGDTRFEGVSTSPATLYLPLESLSKDSRVIVQTFPVEEGVYQDLHVDFELVLLYERAKEVA